MCAGKEHMDEVKSMAHDLEDNDGEVIAKMKATAVLSGNTALGLMSCFPDILKFV